jgi:hypothetical protein
MPKFKAQKQEVTFTEKEILIALQAHYSVKGSAISANVIYSSQLVAEMEPEEYDELKDSYVGLSVIFQTGTAYSTQ